ncbi:MAG: hypothetical protein AAGE52_39605 [Myxococcota bacterium]
MRVTHLTVFALGMPLTATAQSFTATIDSLRGAGSTIRDDSEDILDGFNAADCADDGSQVVLQLNPRPARIDLWHDDSATLDCVDPANRDVNADDRECVHLEGDFVVDSDGTLTIPLAAIAVGDVESERGDDVCTRNRADYEFSLLVSDAAIETGDIGEEYATFTLSVDGSPPNAPVMDDSFLVGNELDVGWDAVSDGADTVSQVSYRVEVRDDLGCAASGAPDAGTLDAGMGDAVDGAMSDGAMSDGAMSDAAMSDASMSDAAMSDELSDAGVDAAMQDAGADERGLIRAFDVGAGNSQATVNLDDLRVAENDVVGVRVASVDRAGNRGAWSDVTCLQRVVGVGLCDILEGGCEEASCSAHRSPNGGMALFALLVFQRAFRRAFGRAFGRAYERRTRFRRRS